MEVLVSAEQRLMLALSLPDGTPGQPLTLAALVELDRSLQLLEQLTHNLGLWQQSRPSSLAAFRQAAAAVVAYLAQPSLARGQAGAGGAAAGFAVSCPPQTPFERRLAARPALGMDAGCCAGWLDACARGAAPEGGGASAGAGVPSEYAARLAEACYACCARALGFLAATAPAVDPSEVGQLGSMWPSRSALTAVAGQCSALGRQLLSGVGVSTRRRRLAACCARIIGTCVPFLELVGGSKEARAKAREEGAALQRALALEA
jgi:hypothetical protein